MPDEEDLAGYLEDLEAEIARVRSVIEAKKRHRNSAEAFFRKP